MASGKIDDIPRPEGTFYVVKSMTDGKVLNYELVGMNKLYSMRRACESVGYRHCLSPELSHHLDASGGDKVV